jgi:hypothetical protein
LPLPGPPGAAILGDHPAVYGEPLARIEALHTLWLDGTGVTDAGLAHLRGLRMLLRLSLRGVPVCARGSPS